MPVEATPTTVLEVDAVRFAYPGGAEVLRGVTLRAEGGVRLGLVGPNGAGKTTLLRVAAGLVTPTAGGVRLRGRAMAQYERMEVARVVAWVPQEIQTIFGFSVSEVVLMGRYPHMSAFSFPSGDDRRTAQRCLEEVGIGHLAGRPFRALSGGEKQRAVIASALAQEPDVMLLDEPAAALDLAGQVALAGILGRLRDKGLAIVVVTHDLNFAARTSDRIALLKDGALVSEGDPETVLTEDALRDLYGAPIRVESFAPDGLPVVIPDLTGQGGAS
jgi:iron complex transport system ATP-binding protein